jgi:hypothetical protein
MRVVRAGRVHDPHPRRKSSATPGTRVRGHALVRSSRPKPAKGGRGTQETRGGWLVVGVRACSTMAVRNAGRRAWPQDGTPGARQGPVRGASGAIRESRTRPQQQSASRRRPGGCAVGLAAGRSAGGATRDPPPGEWRNSKISTKTLWSPARWARRQAGLLRCPGGVQWRSPGLPSLTLDCLPGMDPARRSPYLLPGVARCDLSEPD